MAQPGVEFQIRADDSDAVRALLASAEAAKTAARAQQLLAQAERQRGRDAVAAAKAALAAQREAERAESQRLAALASASNNAAHAAGNLRFQLFDIGQSLAGGMNPLMVLSQQGPQVAQALGQASASGATMGQTFKAALGPVASMGPALAAVAAAVAVLGGAYMVFSAELENATAKMEAQAAAATRMQQATAAWSTGIESVTDAVALATGELDEYDIMGRRMERTVDASAEAMREANAAAIAAAEATLTQARADESGIVSALRQVELAKARAAAFEQEVAATKAAIPTAIAHKMATDAASESTRGSSRASSEATQRLRDQERAAKAAAKSLADYGRTHLSVTQSLLDLEGAIFDAQGHMPKASGAFAELANELDSLVPRAVLSDLEKLAELGGRVQEAFATGKIDADQYAALTDAINKGTTAPGTTSSASGTAGVVGAALSNPLGAIGGVHPIAGAIVAGLQSAAAMDSDSSVFTEAADLIVEALGNLPAFVDSALAAVQTIIAEAPVALIEALPGVIQALAQGIPAVIQTIVQLIPDVVIALAQALPAMVPDLILLLGQAIIGAVPMIIIALVQALTDPAFYVGLGEAFIKGIESMFEGLTGIGEDINATTQAGGGFQLFGAPSAGASSANGGGAPSIIQINPADMWSDFTTWIDTETSKLGRL